MKDTKDMFKIDLIEETLERAFYSKNTLFSATRLLFFKYVLDNFVGATTKEDYQRYSRIKTMLAAQDVDAGPNEVGIVLDIVDQYYKVDGLFSNSRSDYAKELFGMDAGWQRKTAEKTAFTDIMSILASIDLEDDEFCNKGKMLVESLLVQMQNKNARSRMFTESCTRQEVCAIANSILKVQDGDTFLDFASGSGMSTISIVGNKKANVINFDINEEVLSISAMLYLMYGYSEIKFRCADTLLNPGLELNPWHYDIQQVRANKIFVDPPVGIKVDTTEKYGYRIDSTIAAIDQVTESLEYGGKGLVTVHPSILYGSSIQQNERKKRLIEQGYLSAVVALPITFGRTAVTMSLMIISKEKNDQVLFVNANSKAFSQYVEKIRPREEVINQQGIDFISDIVNNKLVVNEISALVDAEVIMQKGYDLMPTTYVKERMMQETLTMEEIEAELKSLYAKLGVLN